MSSAFCSLDEAFAGPVMPVKKKKEKEKKEVPEPMTSPVNQTKPEAAGSDSFFPLPGETAESEEWQKAFTLEGSNLPRPDGSVPVAGKPTLWRDIPKPVYEPIANRNSDVHQRLDALSRQLEVLTAGSPMQSTAELFLFVAIGLILLLAIDTLLRCATSIAIATVQRGGVRRSLFSR
jgi:hypothetical protein